jgi:hypothetical protein
MKVFVWAWFVLSTAGVLLRILQLAIVDYPRTMKETRQSDAWRLAWAIAIACWTLILLLRN